MLSPEAIEHRRKGVGASDARKIVDGEWYDLWAEKTGRAKPQDLSWNFAVRLGEVTETLNLNWYAHSVSRPVTRRGEVVVSKKYPILRCTLDGFDEGLRGPVQAKHCNPFAKDRREHYTPQVMHEMIVTGTEKGVLSVIYGTNEPVYELIELDEMFADDYIRRCNEFWHFVTTDTAPPGGPAEAMAPPEQPKLMRKVSFEGNNIWASTAADWLGNRKAAATFKDAEKVLKELVEPDVGEASGHGIKISRNKAGSLSIKGL